MPITKRAGKSAFRLTRESLVRPSEKAVSMLSESVRSGKIKSKNTFVNNARSHGFTVTEAENLWQNIILFLKNKQKTS